MPKDLKSYIKDNKRFLKIKDGETIRVVYVGYKVAANPQDPEKEIVLYQVKEPGSENVLIWKSASIVVAERMAQLSPGEEIEITRTGESTETKYKITTV